jgi:proteic killer suppression protein
VYLVVATLHVDERSLTLYTFGMAIRNFRHKGLECLFAEDDVRGIPPAFAPKLKRMLFALANAAAVSDMALFPGWRLHPLTGDLHGFWSLTVTGNWRIVFRFENGEARDVDLVD